MKEALLVLVSGPPASGRTALAARIAAELGVPLVTRDAVRAGMVETQSGWTVTPAVDLVARSTAAWRTTIAGLMSAGVTVVTEHPLRSEVVPADLAALAGPGRIKVVRCRLDRASVAPPPPPEPKLRPMRTGGMIVERPQPRPGPGRRPPDPERDPSVVLGVPVLTVSPTPRGYKPPLAEIVWFLRQAD